jgi:hypothetical protein
MSELRKVWVWLSQKELKEFTEKKYTHVSSGNLYGRAVFKHKPIHERKKNANH